MFVYRFTCQEYQFPDLSWTCWRACLLISFSWDGHSRKLGTGQIFALTAGFGGRRGVHVFCFQVLVFLGRKRS
jgi:hypothetical protein